MVNIYRNGNGHSSFSNVPLNVLDPGKLRGFKPLINSLAKRFDELSFSTAEERNELERELEELRILDEWGRDVAVKIRAMTDLIESRVDRGPLSDTPVLRTVLAGMRSKSAS
jgi:hypothetical protein